MKKGTETLLGGIGIVIILGIGLWMAYKTGDIQWGMTEKQWNKRIDYDMNYCFYFLSGAQKDSIDDSIYSEKKVEIFQAFKVPFEFKIDRQKI
jgi:hypothetical protein